MATPVAWQQKQEFCALFQDGKDLRTVGA